MMKILFLFLDGVGLGIDDIQSNPLARAEMPVLQSCLDGRRLLASSVPFEGHNADLLAIDACLSVRGLPQSATGQATILTGKNIPAAIGYHYGPKPNPDVAKFLNTGGLFGDLSRAGCSVAFLNAYPDSYFDGITSGKRLYSAIPLAATNAGLPLFTAADFFAMKAVSADFTGQGWRERLHHPDAPLLTPQESGVLLARLAQNYDFSFFEYWLSDYAGHQQDMPSAIALLEQFDFVLEGILSSWDLERDLILITSDHGNLEDLSTRLHTANPVPLLLLGSSLGRKEFSGATNLAALAGKISCLLL